MLRLVRSSYDERDKVFIIESNPVCGADAYLVGWPGESSVRCGALVLDLESKIKHLLISNWCSGKASKLAALGSLSQ